MVSIRYLRSKLQVVNWNSSPFSKSGWDFGSKLTLSMLWTSIVDSKWTPGRFRDLSQKTPFGKRWRLISTFFFFLQLFLHFVDGKLMFYPYRCNIFQSSSPTGAQSVQRLVLLGGWDLFFFGTGTVWVSCQLFFWKKTQGRFA